jgi:hypothetical protein
MPWCSPLLTRGRLDPNRRNRESGSGQDPLHDPHLRETRERGLRGEEHAPASASSARPGSDDRSLPLLLAEVVSTTGGSR